MRGVAELAKLAGHQVRDLLPEHTSTSITWAYEVVGVAFSVLGIAFIAVGLQRARAVEQALDRGSFAPLNPTLLAALVIAGVLLGIGVIGLVIFG